MTAYRDHPDYRALVATCGERLADDTPRLVLADWLDDHGDPDRAAFIRRQCEAARDDGGRTYVRLQPNNAWPRPVAFADLVRWRPWRPGGHSFASPMVVMAGRGKGYSPCVGWHRGFPAVVSCTARQWHLHHARFKVPVMVCLTNAGRGEWGANVDTYADPETEYVSMVDSGVSCRAPGRGATDTEALYRAAFPNVAVFRSRPCTAYLLDLICIRGGVGSVLQEAALT